MKLPVLLLLGGGLILLLALVGIKSLTDPPAPNYALMQVQADAARDAALREANQAAALAPFVTFTAEMFQILLVVIMAGSVVGAGMLAADWWKAGAVRRRVLVLAAQAQVEAARRPNVPHTYSPHWANRQDLQGGPVADAPQLAAAPPFVAPSIGEAAERGAFRDGRYIMGYAITDGAPAVMDQENGRSFLIAGQGGSGGTTALLAAGLQEILMPLYLPGQQESARFLIIDYHARKPQGLLRRIGDELGDRVIATAHTPNEVMRVTSYFEAECRARVNGAPTPYTLILLADEIGNLLDDADYADVAPKLLAAFAHANNAYRAVGGKAIVRCHTLQASAWGNSAAVRQSFHARSGMRLDEGAGILLGLKPAIARTLLALPAGQSYVTGPGLPPTHVISSNVRRGDIGTVLDLAGYRAKARTVHTVGALAVEIAPVAAPPPMPGKVLQGDWWATTSASAEGKPQPAPFMPASAPEGNAEGMMEGNAEGSAEGNPTSIRIYDLFMAGQLLPAIVEAVYGVSSTNGGRKYQAAKEEAEILLRDEFARRLAERGA